jgi:hypothetical protein
MQSLSESREKINTCTPGATITSPEDWDMGISFSTDKSKKPQSRRMKMIRTNKKAKKVHLMALNLTEMGSLSKKVEKPTLVDYINNFLLNQYNE